MADFPNIQPSYITKKNITPRMLRTEFGDGYSQRAGDGINVIQEQWTVVFNNRSVNDIDTVEDFLIARGGHESFSWTAPRDSSPKLWICVNWMRTFQGSTVDSLEASFDRVYDLD